MSRLLARSTRNDTLIPDTTLFRSQEYQVPGAERAFELVAGLDRVGDRLLDGLGAEQAHAWGPLSTGNRSVRHASPSATPRRMGRAQRDPSLFLVDRKSTRLNSSH